jgi:hypothetical protein
MNFKSLNLNLKRKEIENYFLFRTSQRAESSARSSSHCVTPRVSNPHNYVNHMFKRS